MLATTSTAGDGAYSLTFTSAGTAPLQVQVLAKTASPPILVQDNTSGDAVWALGAGVPAGGGTLDVHATHGWGGSAYVAANRTAAPFAILDSMYVASTAFAAARPALVFPQLKVNWSPKNSVDPNGTIAQGFLGTSFYDPQTNQIYLVGKDGEDTDEYDGHVIVHEYGHFFEANFSRADSLGGDHTSGDLLDPRDAFSEGWGDAASALLLQDPVYSDTYWNAGALDGFGFDLETAPTPTDDPHPGAFSEFSVMRLLYDASDATNEPFDPLALGVGPLADAFTGGHETTDAFTTIASFITALKAAGASGPAVDALLAHYGLGAITSDFGDGDAPLRAMYTNLAALPLGSTSVPLDGRVGFNFKDQNKYWVFTGTGAQVTVTATSLKDVGLAAYAKGVEVGFADNTTTGTETFSFTSTSGVVYVVNLVGYGTGGSYSATVSITSP